MCDRLKIAFLLYARNTSVQSVWNYGKRNMHQYAVRQHNTIRPIRFAFNRQFSPSACFSDLHSSKESSKYKHELSALRELEELSLNLSIVNKDGQAILRHNMYPGSADPLIAAILAADSSDEIFQLFEHKNFNGQHASQAIVSLWDLLKTETSQLTYKSLPYLKQLANRSENIQTNPTFCLLKETINSDASNLSDEALAFSLLSLRRFGIPPWDPSLHHILCESLRRVENFQLTSLAVWCLSMKDISTSGRLIIASALPHVEKHMKSMSEDIDSIKSLSVCMIATAHMITKDLACKYTTLVEHFLNRNIITNNTPIRVLNRIAQALKASNNIVPVSHLHLQILHLMEQSPELDDCSFSVIVSINKSMISFREPVQLSYRTENIACKLLDHTENIGPEHLGHLSCISQFVSSEQKKRIEKILLKILNEESCEDLEPYYRSIFDIIRRLKIVNSKLIDLFWKTVVKLISLEFENHQQPSVTFYRSIHWYMFFNNNLGGTYRLNAFEKQMLHWIDEILRGPLACTLPCRKYSQLAAFVLAYGNPTVAEHFVDKLLQMEEQIMVRDIHILSRGVQYLETSYGRWRSLAAVQTVADLTLLLDRRIQHCLEQSSSLSNTVTLLLAISQRRRRDSFALNELVLQKCEKHLDQLNAGIIHHLAFGVEVSRYLPPKILDEMISYVIQRHQYIPVSIQALLANLLFHVGYFPPSIDTLFPIIADTLFRELNRLTGLHIINCALALLMHHHLPSQLLNAIFSVKFLDKLDAEVAACYSKATYPGQIRRALMQLNRAVCVDVPESGVPWFHEKYCQEQNEISPPAKSSFHMEVDKCLTRVLGGSTNFKTFVYTPYYHLIDFEVLVNSRGKVIQPNGNVLPGDQIEKLAILLLFPDAFTVNARSPTGIHQLNRRHLEILGYRVIGIPYHDWNSLFLSSTDSKIEFLREKIFANRNS